HGQDWVRAADYSTTQRQHSQGNRPDVLGTSNPELANQRHAMSKEQALARCHHSLIVTDPRWATPNPTPLGQLKHNPSGLSTIVHRPHWANKGLQPKGVAKYLHYHHSTRPPAAQKH
ncbi:hypothetical protein AVEN_30259-1, partial [Araneus ventricosus]